MSVLLGLSALSLIFIIFQISYFGLKYGCSKLAVGKWVDLDKTLFKEIKRLAVDNMDDVLIHFRIRFFATDMDLLRDDTTR